MNMKKIILSAFVAMFLMSACEKVIQKTETSSPKYDNVAIPIMSNAKEGTYYEVKVKVGHSGENCPGCIYRNGKLCHIDCQGFGTYCNPTATVKVEGGGKGPVYQMITINAYDLTDQDTFFFPNRSLLILDTTNVQEIWLNIPEQELIRDYIQGNFVFQNVTYDNTPLFQNE